MFVREAGCAVLCEFLNEYCAHACTDESDTWLFHIVEENFLKVIKKIFTARASNKGLHSVAH